MNFATRFFSLVLILAFPFLAIGQITSLTDAAGLSEGTYTFNFGDGDFQAYVDDEGWILWMQYHHAGGTNPALNVIPPGNDLPIYDNSPLGTDLSGDASKWGHGTQDFAGSIPDADLWLRWEAETSNHSRKIHFESPVLGKFQATSNDDFTPDITYKNIHRADHTAELPDKAGGGSQRNSANEALISGPFWRFNVNSWEVNTSGRWNVDDVRNSDGSLILSEHSTIHRVWVKPVPFNSSVLLTALDELQAHINGVQTLSEEALNQLTNTIYIYSGNLADSETLIAKAQAVVVDYDTEIGPLFTTPTTQNGFNKDLSVAPGFGVERAMVALQQGLFDFVFTPEVLTDSPQFIDGIRFNSCVSFPGDALPPFDPSVIHTTSIRANFADPVGINPSYNINGDGTEHAFRPTGLYLAPGSVATVTVPSSLVGKDYYIRVGAHEWDLNFKPVFKRLDRISKRFPIESTTIEVFNPLGGAIGILVPYGATEGILEVSTANVIEAPFYSLKSFYETADFAAELDKPAPWAVFESDNVMYTIPKHSIVPGKHDLRKTLQDWDKSLIAINTISGRQPTADKHDLYMISDLMIRGGAFSIGYPMSNNEIRYASVPGPANFIDGPGPKYEVNYHEYGHAYRISKFPGEEEAAVNFLYIMGLNFGLGEDLEEAVKFSFVPNTYDIDNSAIHRLVSNSFGTERDFSNSTTNEVRYQHRGYAHYFEIVKMLGWCPLKEFWESEFTDFENGTDHGINSQAIDSRILRMSIAADTDLRPLFHVFGILPQDPVALQNAFDQNGISASSIVYNRLQEYLDLIPADNAEFADYAREVYPNVFSAGPSANQDFGVGWHYQKTLTYDATEAQTRTTSLQAIIDQYYPTGQPTVVVTTLGCCISEAVVIELIDNEIVISGAIPPYTVTVDTSGTTQTVTVMDANGCVTTVDFAVSSLYERNAIDVLISPNPASTSITVQLPEGNYKIEHVALLSINGQVTRSYPNVDSSIDITDVNEGLYILQVVLTDGSVINQRVSILR
ncbi:MAG: M60 family peptidase N-terminal accessory domain-containing protein [Saprospiraceae bacterium]